MPVVVISRDGCGLALSMISCNDYEMISKVSGRSPEGERGERGREKTRIGRGKERHEVYVKIYKRKWKEEAKGGKRRREGRRWKERKKGASQLFNDRKQYMRKREREGRGRRVGERETEGHKVCVCEITRGLRMGAR